MNHRLLPRILCGIAILTGISHAAEPPRFEPGKAAAHFPVDAAAIVRTPVEHRASYADVLKLVTPKVVSVFPAQLAKPGESPEDELLKRFFGMKKEDDPDDRFRGVGSGVIISADGYILTNSHVVHLQNGKLADEIIVEFSTKRRMPAVIVGADPRSDIAVLKVDAKDLPVLPMADSSQIEVGDLVFAVGNPFKIGITATMGMVSATRRGGIGVTGAEGYESFIQTDAAINPGNSGGALCDARGRLIGINTAIIGGHGGNVGIGFAVPVHLARRVLFNVLENGKVVRGFVGARVKSVDDGVAKNLELSEVKGAVVEELLETGPAGKAGLKKGDVILRIGTEEVDDAGAFRIAVAFATPGTTVPVSIVREGKTMELPVKIETQEEVATAGTTMEIEALPGVKLREVTEEPAGLRVESVTEESPVAKRLLPGMVITEINDQKIATRTDASTALQSGPNKFRVRNGEITETLLIKLK